MGSDRAAHGQRPHARDGLHQPGLEAHRTARPGHHRDLAPMGGRLLGRHLCRDLPGQRRAGEPRCGGRPHAPRPVSGRGAVPARHALLQSGAAVRTGLRRDAEGRRRRGAPPPAFSGGGCLCPHRRRSELDRRERPAPRQTARFADRTRHDGGGQGAAGKGLHDPLRRGRGEVHAG